MTASTANVTNAMDLVAMMAIDEIATCRGVSPTKVVGEFLASKTAGFLYDDSLKYWWDGPTAVASSFEKEQGNVGL